MHRNGHCGTALVVYAPVIAVLVAIDLRGMALLGGAVVISGTMLPDLDTRIPFVPHRGPTHTVWFAVFVGVLVGAGGVVLGLQRGSVVAVQYGAFAVLVGTLTILAHPLTDALTPMGVRPFVPLADTSYSLGIATAGNTIANHLLLGFGLAATLVAFVIGAELNAMIPVYVDPNRVYRWTSFTLSRPRLPRGQGYWPFSGYTGYAIESVPFARCASW